MDIIVGLTPTPPADLALPDTISFGASWNRSTRFLTLLFIAVAALIVYLSYPGWPLSIGFLLTASGVCAAIGFAYVYAPSGYLVTEESVAIRRHAGLKSMPFASLRSARLLESSELAESTWRWPAVGGLFGFYGSFETPALGRHQWYASRDQDLVLLQTDAGPVILSPDGTLAFVREVNQRLRSSNRI